jgi:hypothetical protein
MSAIAVGDKVTIMPAHNGNVYGILHAVVRRIDPLKFTWYTKTGYGEIIAQSGEGVTWIHGHHTGNSNEVAAMRVAHALELGA